MDLVKCFIPLFVWLHVDVTNDMDICKFYPKFAQKGSHSENIREKYCHYFQSKGFVFKISKAVTSYFSVTFRQRPWSACDFHCSVLNVDKAIPRKAKRGSYTCKPWKQKIQLCIHVLGKTIYSHMGFLIMWGKKKKTSFDITGYYLADNFYRVTDNVLTY